MVCWDKIIRQGFIDESYEMILPDLEIILHYRVLRYETLMQDNDMTKEKQDFVPNKNILPRIMRVLLENSSINRTALAIAANLNYSILSKYVIWLETKSFVEFTVQDGKLTVKLTESGRKFAVTLASLPY